MNRCAMWGLFLLSACGSPMMGPPDSGNPMDSGVPMNTMLTTTLMLTGTIAAPEPTSGYDSNNDVGSFILRQQAMGAFKVDINMGFTGRPTAMTYTSPGGGFSCNVTITSGTAAADTWVALFNQPPQMDKGTCSLTLTSATVGATGYVVDGSLSVTGRAQGGASAGMVQLSGTF